MVWDENHVRKAYEYLLNYKYKNYKFVAKVFGSEAGTDIFTIEVTGDNINHMDDPYMIPDLHERPNIKLIVAPFCIVYEDSPHANLLIINKANSTVELYDPNGVPQSLELDVNALVRRFFMSLYPYIFDSYRFLTYAETCPIKGFQYLESEMYHPLDKEGYCIHWSIFLLDLRLRYYRYNPLDIQTMMIKKTREMNRDNSGTSKAFLNFIRKYIYYINNF